MSGVRSGTGVTDVRIGTGVSGVRSGTGVSGVRSGTGVSLNKGRVRYSAFPYNTIATMIYCNVAFINTSPPRSLVVLCVQNVSFPSSRYKTMEFWEYRIALSEYSSCTREWNK